MTKTGRLRKTAGWRMLIAAAPLVALLGVPARAATITFNPGNGDLPNIVNFGYAPANVLAQGAVANPSSSNVFYQSVLTSASDANGPVAGVGAGGNFNGSGNEFTVIAGFKVTSSVAGDTINTSVTSAPGFRTGTANPNFLEIFAATPGSASSVGGTGFWQSSTPILTGYVLPPSGVFGTGSFTLSPVTSATPPLTPLVPLNGTGQTSPLEGTSTTQGNGSTQLLVQVVTANSAFFPGLTPALTQLTLSTSNFLPESHVTPTDLFSDGTGSANVTAHVSPINQVSGPDLVFESDASNGFSVVPEPSSIIPAMTAAMLVSSFMLLRRRRAKAPAA